MTGEAMKNLPSNPALMEGETLVQITLQYQNI